MLLEYWCALVQAQASCWLELGGLIQYTTWHLYYLAKTLVDVRMTESVVLVLADLHHAALLLWIKCHLVKVFVRS